jgi:predicted  nucleic acid-binding Zn-ribbon protein
MGLKTQHDFVLVGKDRASKVIRGVAKTTDSLIDSTYKLTSTISNSINIVGAMSRGMSSMAGAMQKPIDLAIEQARVEAQLDAVLRSTSEAAGLNAGQLKAMASEMQGVTTFSDEAIIGMQNLLLTFTNIGGEGGIFERTTKVALDVATAMGSDLKGAAIQLGKALNDPVLGVSALGEVGITFSQQQKEVIKQLQATNDIAGAQTIILEELERQFGGSAEAAANTFGGAMTQVQNAMGGVMEALGDFVVQNAGIIAIFKELSSGILVFATDLGKLGESQEGQIKIAQVFQKVLVGLVNTFATFIEVMGSMAKMFVDSSIAVADFLGVEALLTKEQRELLPAMQAVDAELGNIQLSMISVSSNTKEHRERYAELNVELKEVSKRKRELKAEYDSLGLRTEAITEKTDAAGKQMRALADRLAEVDVATAVTTAANEQLVESYKEVQNAVAVTAEVMEKVAGPSMSDLNRQVFTYLDALKASTEAVGDLGRRETSRYLDLRKNLEDLPLDQQIAEVQVFEEHLKNLWDRAVGGSAETAAAMGQVSVAVTDVADQADKAAPKVEKSFTLSIGGILDAIKEIVPAVVKESKRAEHAWERSAERMGDSLADSLNSAYKDAITGQATLFDGLQNFSDTFKSSLTSAFMDPILGAQSPLAELFTAALSPVAMLGASISEMIFRPLVDGILTYFGVKKAAETADAAASIGTQAGTAAAITGTQMASVAAMLPGLFTAASLALVATLGGAAAASGLLPGVVSAALGQAKAAQALTLTGFEDGGFISREQVVRVGEKDRPEVIIPLTKPDRARALLGEMFARNPELMSPQASKPGGSRNGGAVGSTFNITINGATDPQLTSTKVAQKIDRLLGRRIRGGVS